MATNNALLLAQYRMEHAAGIPQASGGFDWWLVRSGASVVNGAVVFQWPDA